MGNEQLQQNWDQVKEQLRSEYPQLEESDLEGDPDEVADMIAEKTGQNRETVMSSMSAIAGQGDQSAEQSGQQAQQQSGQTQTEQQTQSGQQDTSGG